MKKVLLFLALAIAGFISVSYFYQHNTAEAHWLHGMWQLTYDPDGDDKDYMEFYPDGQVELKSSPDKPYITCQYSSKIGHVIISCMVKGTERELALEVSPERNRLTNSSGAYYQPMP